MSRSKRTTTSEPAQVATPEVLASLPLFDGYPYLMTRLAPALYNLIVLPAREEDRLIDLAQAQVWANRLPAALVLGERRAVFSGVDGSPSVSAEPPRGGIVIAGHLAPLETFQRTHELRRRERLAARFVEEHRGTGYVLGDITKGGYEANEAQLKGFATQATLRDPGAAGLPGLAECPECGEFSGLCLDPNARLKDWVVPVSCRCENENRCAACGKLLYERKLAANFYDPSDGRIWHVPGFMGRCACADAERVWRAGFAGMDAGMELPGV